MYSTRYGACFQSIYGRKYFFICTYIFFEKKDSRYHKMKKVMSFSDQVKNIWCKFLDSAFKNKVFEFTSPRD